MKTDNPKVQKKVAKKAAKKELELNLTQKFFEAITHLGHDAEKIGADVAKAAKSVAAKLSKKFTEATQKTEKKAAKVKLVEKNAFEKTKDIKMTTVKGAKKAQKEVEKAVAKAKPVVNSIKVAPIATEEKAADLIAPKPSSNIKATAVKRTVTSSVPAKSAAKPTTKQGSKLVAKSTPKPVVKEAANPSVKPVVKREPRAKKTTEDPETTN